MLLFLNFFQGSFYSAPCRVWLLPPSQGIFCLSLLFGVLLELFVLGFVFENKSFVVFSKVPACKELNASVLAAKQQQQIKSMQKHL